MNEYTTGGLQALERPEAQLSNHRVTARIVREDDGEHHRMYKIDGREVGDRHDLQAALRGGR